jgi:hypothetical protein
LQRVLAGTARFGRGVVQAVRAVDGVRVTKVAGVTCYSQLDDTEVHDALRGAVRELIVSSSSVFPEREEKDPGWFSPSATDLFPERQATESECGEAWSVGQQCWAEARTEAGSNAPFRTATSPASTRSFA